MLVRCDHSTTTPHRPVAFLSPTLVTRPTATWPRASGQRPVLHQASARRRQWCACMSSPCRQPIMHAAPLQPELRRAWASVTWSRFSLYFRLPFRFFLRSAFFLLLSWAARRSLSYFVNCSFCLCTCSLPLFPRSLRRDAFPLEGLVPKMPIRAFLLRSHPPNLAPSEMHS